MSIRLSPKYGLNPSLSQCFYCGGDKNEVIVPGHIRERGAMGPTDVEAPRKAVWNTEPCDQCKAWMAQGIILIGTQDGESGNNPLRTGRFAVLKEEALRRMVRPPELVDAICKKRVAFIEETTWRRLGLPLEDTDDAQRSDAG